MCFILLNPGAAPVEKDGPTLTRCIHLAQSWGFDAMEVVNLYAWRETHPQYLLCAMDPVGPDNDQAIQKAMKKCQQVVVAWGSSVDVADRVTKILAMINKPLYCLGTTKDGSPKHPLSNTYETQPILWKGHP